MKRIRWRFFHSLNNQMPFKFFNDPNSLPRVLLFGPDGSSAEVLLYGGKVVSWKNRYGEELLVMGSKTTGRSPKETKGGISVCFPQFSNVGTIRQNLSTRSKLCSLNKCPLHLIPTGSPSSVDLIFKSTTNETWPRSFELRLCVSLGPGKLTLISYVRNTDNKSFEFTFALHNYLSISDISEVRVEGLETLDYFDNLLQGERSTEQADAITFDGEVDRVYTQTPATIAIVDHEKKRTFVIHKKGLPDAGLIRLTVYQLHLILNPFLNSIMPH